MRYAYSEPLKAMLKEASHLPVHLKKPRVIQREIDGLSVECICRNVERNCLDGWAMTVEFRWRINGAAAPKRRVLRALGIEVPCKAGAAPAEPSKASADSKPTNNLNPAS